MDTIRKIIRENFERAQERVFAACQRSGRDPKDVKLLLASKTVEPAPIQAASDCGATLVGENRVQELKEKGKLFRDLNFEVHFIGHLQSNKINQALKWVDCVQSVDRLSLAEKLHIRLKDTNRQLPVMIQVNTSAEESKFGAKPDQALPLIEKVAQFPTLRVVGLMTIGLFSAETVKVRKCFKILAGLREKARALNIPRLAIDQLSMGMSDDLEIAVEEGATIIRLGRAIFGQRR